MLSLSVNNIATLVFVMPCLCAFGVCGSVPLVEDGKGYAQGHNRPAQHNLLIGLGGDMLRQSQCLQECVDDMGFSIRGTGLRARCLDWPAAGHSCIHRFRKGPVGTCLHAPG